MSYASTLRNTRDHGRAGDATPRRVFLDDVRHVAICKSVLTFKQAAVAGRLSEGTGSAARYGSVYSNA